MANLIANLDAYSLKYKGGIQKETGALYVNPGIYAVDPYTAPDWCMKKYAILICASVVPTNYWSMRVFFLVDSNNEMYFLWMAPNQPDYKWKKIPSVSCETEG